MKNLESHKNEALFSIQHAAELLNHATSKLGVKSVNWESRSLVQTAFKNLLKDEIFRENIEKSRPDVHESHLIFTPHGDLEEKCLVWWIHPYNSQIYPEDSWKIFSYAFFGIEPTTGDIPIYWDEEGETILCGYDEV